MKEVNFVKVADMKTLEQYGASLITAMISLKTLESYQSAAIKIGILDEDELESCKTILWEIKRLILCYQSQMNHVLERTSIDESEILLSLQKMMPDIKIPKKRKKDEKSITTS